MKDMEGRGDNRSAAKILNSAKDQLTTPNQVSLQTLFYYTIIYFRFLAKRFPPIQKLNYRVSVKIRIFFRSSSNFKHNHSAESVSLNNCTPLSLNVSSLSQFVIALLFSQFVSKNYYTFYYLCLVYLLCHMLFRYYLQHCCLGDYYIVSHIWNYNCCIIKIHLSVKHKTIFCVFFCIALQRESYLGIVRDFGTRLLEPLFGT